MARRRRVSARELERRLVKRLGDETLIKVEAVVHRLRKYVIARTFRAYVAASELPKQASAAALTQTAIEQAIRERMTF